ncbi:MAG TPA: zf-HC2 domain-containing protein [Thermoanaerobaculia bacterium]|nr:zf-HC2 domain-containing protein [Thermoanaerobaculia bacterium]
MDHQYIADNGLLERYHQGSLPPDEEARFEEHFVGCPECTEQLELARGFQRGLKTMVAEDVAQAAIVQAGLFAWLARRGRLTQWGLALAALLVFFVLGVLPALWFHRESTDLRQTAAALGERGNVQERNAADLRRRLAESERQRAAERRELEAKIAQAKPPESPHGLASSAANLSVVLLTAVRGPGEPPATIDLSKTGDLVALAVDPGGDARFATYRATLTQAGATVYRQANLKPNALEAVMITFPASSLTPGEYRLRLEGVKPDGTAAEIGGYPFRVVGKQPDR